MKDQSPENFCRDSANQNIETLFEYTKSFVNDKCKDIELINLKLTTFLGFSGVVLGFAFGLQGKMPEGSITLISLSNWICYFSKGLAALLSIWSVILCSIGLIGSNGTGGMVDPKDFRDTQLIERKRKADFYIINTWIDVTIPELEISAMHKQKYLNRAINILIGVAVCSGINLLATSRLQ